MADQSIIDALFGGQSWLERANQERLKAQAAYLQGGPAAMMANTQGIQDLSGGFGGTTIGKIKTYPMAPKGTWYGNETYAQTGGRMVEMSPEEYLKQTKPLEIDEISRENIDDLKNHIQSGGRLDPPALYEGGKEDGRHRAIAAKELGIDKIPVITWR